MEARGPRFREGSGFGHVDQIVILVRFRLYVEGEGLGSERWWIQPCRPDFDV